MSISYIIYEHTMNPLDLISGKRLIELTKTLVEIPSETGKEKEIGDWVIDFFENSILHDNPAKG